MTVTSQPSARARRQFQPDESAADYGDAALRAESLAKDQRVLEIS
jgi:hypothetical protein